VKTNTPTKIPEMDEWFRYCMPYTFIALPSVGCHKYVYLPVNCNYKPLGQMTKDFVDYDTFSAQTVVFTDDPNTFDGVWIDSDGLWLYTDAPATRRDYYTRLDRLKAHCWSKSKPVWR
jgi:hypothetical protein